MLPVEYFEVLIGILFVALKPMNTFNSSQHLCFQWHLHQGQDNSRPVEIWSQLCFGRVSVEGHRRVSHEILLWANFIPGCWQLPAWGVHPRSHPGPAHMLQRPVAATRGRRRPQGALSGRAGVGASPSLGGSCNRAAPQGSTALAASKAGLRGRAVVHCGFLSKDGSSSVTGVKEAAGMGGNICSLTSEVV